MGGRLEGWATTRMLHREFQNAMALPVDAPADDIVLICCAQPESGLVIDL